MLEPIAPSRLSVVALAASCLALVAACRPEAEPPAEAPAAPTAAATPVIPVPLPPALGRTELLRAMDDAAAAYASGQAPKSDGLAGRRFAIRQAFGCAGSSPTEDNGDGLGRWSWKGENEAIELSLTPGDWTGSALVAGAAADWEAVEGIWLPRPWLRSEGCPGVRGDPLASGPIAASPQTMGLAAVFEQDGSRLGRRKGRAYSFTQRGQDGRPPSPPVGGYRLILEGRLASFDDGRAIHCRAAAPDQRPVCVAAARLDRVAFEDASGAVLSEWRPH